MAFTIAPSILENDRAAALAHVRDCLCRLAVGAIQDFLRGRQRNALLTRLRQLHDAGESCRAMLSRKLFNFERDFRPAARISTLTLLESALIVHLFGSCSQGAFAGP
jgi:hypothetical protein